MCCEDKCKILKLTLIFIIIIILFILIISVLLLCINNQNQDKSILVATAQIGDNTQTGNAIISFSQNQIQVGEALSHNPGSSEIMINKNGIYQISYQLTGDSQEIGTFNFNAILAVNNVPILETLNEGPVLQSNISNNRYTLTSTVIVQLNAGDILQLEGLSLEEVEYTNARIDIEEIY